MLVTRVPSNFSTGLRTQPERLRVLLQLGTNGVAVRARHRYRNTDLTQVLLFVRFTLPRCADSRPAALLSQSLVHSALRARRLGGDSQLGHIGVFALRSKRGTRPKMVRGGLEPLWKVYSRSTKGRRL